MRKSIIKKKTGIKASWLCDNFVSKCTRFLTTFITVLFNILKCSNNYGTVDSFKTIACLNLDILISTKEKKI